MLCMAGQTEDPGSVGQGQQKGRDESPHAAWKLVADVAKWFGGADHHRVGVKQRGIHPTVVHFSIQLGARVLHAQHVGG